MLIQVQVIVEPILKGPVLVAMVSAVLLGSTIFLLLYVVPYQANSGSGSRPIPMPRKPATSAHYISEERKRIKASIDAEANKPLTDEEQITDLTDEIFR